MSGGLSSGQGSVSGALGWTGGLRLGTPSCVGDRFPRVGGKTRHDLLFSKIQNTSPVMNPTPSTRHLPFSSLPTPTFGDLFPSKSTLNLQYVIRTTGGMEPLKTWRWRRDVTSPLSSSIVSSLSSTSHRPPPFSFGPLTPPVYKDVVHISFPVPTPPYDSLNSTESIERTRSLSSTLGHLRRKGSTCIANSSNWELTAKLGVGAPTGKQ